MKKILLLIIFSISVSFSFSQESDNSNKIKLYNELSNAEISIVNQKKVIKLKDIKNEVIVVLFLASWCGPCTQQAEEMKVIKTDFQKKDVYFIGVNVDSEDRKDFVKFLRKNKFNYLMGFANELLFQPLYQVSKRDAIPQTVVIHNGEVKEVYVGGNKTAKIRKKLKEIFDKK